MTYPEKANGGGQKYIYDDDSVNVILTTLFIILFIIYCTELLHGGIISTIFQISADFLYCQREKQHYFPPKRCTKRSSISKCNPLQYT